MTSSRCKSDQKRAAITRRAVFVNVRITDSDGSLMGVCGVGLFMDDLQDLLTLSEQAYGVKSILSNRTVSCRLIPTARTSKMPTFQRQSPTKREARRLFTQARESQASVSRAISKPSLTEDKLTGLPNRNYLKESYGELGVFNTLRYKTLVMFDIDRFKTVNETRDGDKIILGVVEWAKTVLEEKGILFRWAGDEFVIFCELDCDSAVEAFEKFCAKVKETLDVTVSVGIAEIDLSKSIKTNYHCAVQACYIVKENGGNGVRVCK